MIKQSTSVTKVYALGLSLTTVTLNGISKNAGAFGAASAGVVTLLTAPWYKVTLDATDTNTLGDLALHFVAVVGTPTDPAAEQVTAWDPLAQITQTGDSFTRLGAPVGASISADIAEVEGETDTLLAGVNATSINGSATAAANMGLIYGAIEQGTAQGGAASTITLRAGASATDNLYAAQAIFILSGTGAKQTNNITSYVGATKVATVETPWATQPDNTSVYVVLGRVE